MGCAVSKIEHQDAGSTSATRGPQRQCELRKSSVKHAVEARTNLAAAHARYVQSISATAALFKQFADEEFNGGSDTGATAAAAAAPEVVQQPQQMPPVSSSAFSSSFSDESSSSSDNIVITTTTTTTRHTLRLWNTPAEPITAVLSPPRNISLYHRDDDDDEDEDDDDGMFYRPPPPPPVAYQQPQQQRRPSSPPPMPPAEGGDWQYFDIFHPPVRYRHVLSDGDEDMPALESDDGDEPAFQSKREVKLDERKGKGKVLEEDEEEEAIEEESAASSSGTDERLEIDRQGSKDSSLEGNQEQAVPTPPPRVDASKLKDEQQDEVRGDSNKQTEQDQQPRSDALGSPRQLVDVIREQFMRASEAGRPLLRLLEARKIHNTLERGLSDQSSSSRLLSALSLGHWSPREFSASREDFDTLLGEAGGLSGSHAATLDRLSAWEKKMFEEVKSWQNLNVEFDKKRKVLRNLDAKGAKAEAIERTRASMKQLETQISVSLQAIEASSVAIQKITDEEVLPQLMELLEGFTEMWKGMHESHSDQLRVVQQSRFFQYPVLEPTTTGHRNVTTQLESTFTTWGTTLSSLVSAEKEYVKYLTDWVHHASVQPPLEGASRRPLHRKAAARGPKIQCLCEQWHKALSGVGDTAAEKRAQTTAANQDGGAEKRAQMASAVDEMGAAIKAFAETLREIGRQQAEEIRIQKRADVLAKELNKKMGALNNLEKKRSGSLAASREKQEALGAQINEKKAAVDALRVKVENERQKFNKAIHETRLMTLNSLQDGLPKLFKALEASSATCMSAYQDLYTLVKEYPANN